jgi:hypothetical protein
MRLVVRESVASQDVVSSNAFYDVEIDSIVSDCHGTDGNEQSLLQLERKQKCFLCSGAVSDVREVDSA